MKEFHWQMHAADYCNNLRLPANKQPEATDQQTQATDHLACVYVGPSPQILTLPPPGPPLTVEVFSQLPQQLHKITTPVQNGDEDGLTVGGTPWASDSDSEFKGSSVSGSSELSSCYDSVASEELDLYDSKVTKCVC